jgi:hypothetical protein
METAHDPFNAAQVLAMACPAQLDGSMFENKCLSHLMLVSRVHAHLKSTLPSV